MATIAASQKFRGSRRYALEGSSLHTADDKATFETTARALIDRWTAEREFHVTPAEIEHAREYLGRVGMRAAEQADGSFLLERTGRVVSRVQLVVLGLRLLAERTSWGRGRKS